MKKYALFVMIAALVPNYVFGAHSAKYNSLVAEKQRKMEQLEKCSGSVTGWKIAGISTIGLTAVGVAGNIVLANKKSNMDDEIDSMNNQINRVNTQIAQKEQQIAEQKAAEEQIKKAKETQKAKTGKDKPDEQTINEEQPETIIDQNNDCTDDAKQKDSNVVKAVKNGDNCEVVECVPTHLPSDDKTQCEVRGGIKSGYAKDCGSEAKPNDDCSISSNAKVAKCMSVGNKDKSGKPVLTCTAWSCNDNYLLKLNGQGKSMGYCVAKSDAEQECKRQGTNCKPLLKSTPRNNVSNGAYQGCSCEEKKEEVKETNTGIDFDENGSIYRAYTTSGDCWINDDLYLKDFIKCSGLSRGQWDVKFSYGTVVGISKCAVNGGESGEFGNPFVGSGKYCWCKYRSGVNSVSSASWVFSYAYPSANDCSLMCAPMCGGVVSKYPERRRAIFGSVAQ